MGIWSPEWLSVNDYDDFSDLSDQIIAEDAILFGLRMNQGIKLEEMLKISTLRKIY